MISPGEQIGGYTVLHLLGKGGMGEVYLGQHRRVSRRAAIKVLVPELSQNQGVVERFFNEARAASLIRHPGIVEILDCDLYLDQAYIVMEYLDGESFGGYLYRTGPLERDLPFFFGVSAGIAGAVGAAHRAGIVHRDLKPDNVYLHLPTAEPAVTVKVLDFGIAKLSQQDGGPSKTSTGVMLGTPSYMSPEQCRGAGKVDSRSDIYSLGCIFYEALIGTPPFVREGMGDLIIAHVAEPPEPPIQRAPSIPAGLNDLIMRMLAKGADERFQTMDEVVAALRSVAQSSGISLDGALRPRLPVERPPALAEGSQPPPMPPSGVNTTPLGPRTQRASGAGAAPEAPASGSGRVGSAPGKLPRRGTPSPSVRDVVREPSKPTTLGSTASELKAVPAPPSRAGRWVSIGVAAVAVIGVGVFMMSKKGADPGTAAVSAPARPPAAMPPSAPVAPKEVPVTPPPAPEPESLPETVQIDVQGIAADTTVMVDGKSSALPIHLPRGPETHKIVLRAPGEAPRTLQVDGTRDRIVEAALAQKPSGADASGPSRNTGTGPGRRDKPTRRTGDHATPASKPAGSADREAITDI